MKKADECSSIEEIRACIDELDRGIISGIAQRALYVKCAAKFKKTKADVRADDRVREMIASRRLWAEQSAIDPDFIEMLFRSLVDYFISDETREWQKEEKIVSEVLITEASVHDAREILSLQKRAFIQEVEINDNNYNIAPMLQTLDEMRNDFSEYVILKAVKDDRIVGSLRAKMNGTACYIGRVVVEPLFQGQGIGRVLMQAIESRFPDAAEYELFTAVRSEHNRKFYRKAGYSEYDQFEAPDGIRMVMMRKKKNREWDNR